MVYGVILCAITLVLWSYHVHGATDIPYCINSYHKLTKNITNGFGVAGVLPSQLGQSVVCKFATDRKSSQFLSINLKKQDSLNGSLRVMVYDENLSFNLGSLEIKNEQSLQTRLCLDGQFVNYQGKYAAIISGTPSLHYEVSIEFASHHLTINKEKEFYGPRLFFFKTSQSNTNAQLDITVRSVDATKALLRVSTFCEEVEKRGVFDDKKPTISMTFAKKGRITISKVSQPALSGSNPLFIGIVSADNTLENSIDSKNFTIHITNSFNYDYIQPLCFIVFVPGFGGLLVALWALYCFREPLHLGDDSADSVDSGSLGSSIISKASSIACWSGHTPNELTPLIRQPHISLKSTGKEILWAMLRVVKYHWTGHGSRAFSYITCVVGSVLFVGAFQYVYETWNVMIEQGNRDECFYDDLCYRVSPYSDIPFNLMISNMAYVVHGVILAIAVWVMEAELYLHARKKACLDQGNDKKSEAPDDKEQLPQHVLVCSNINSHLPHGIVPKLTTSRHLIDLYANAYKSKYSFSVGYAFAWALIFEGFFSLTYHLCPSKLSFQFDTAFMFVISGLIVVSLFNGLAVRECQDQQSLPRPIEDTSFYLFAIVPLYILNYLGSVFNNRKGPHKSNFVNAIFLVFIVCWYLAMFSWSGFKLFYINIRHGFHNCESRVKLVLFILTIGCTCIAFPILFDNDFPNLFLFSSITVAVMSTVGKIVLKAFKAPPARYPTWKAVMFKAVQLAYVVVALAVMIVAVYVFDGIPTTDKTATPEHSRNLNKECAFLGFYDYHDIWHIMSSFGLLMGAFLVMYISE